MHTKFIVSLLVFAVVAVFLVVQATNDSAATVLLASDLAAHDPQKPLNRIRVAGKVAESEIVYTTEPKIELKFNITNPSKNPHNDQIQTAQQNQSIAVVYNGLKPDMFAAGRDVIIDGEYTNGILVAHKLLTQCPSKYEAPKPDEKYPSPVTQSQKY